MKTKIKAETLYPQLLLNHGAEAEARNDREQTPLHLASLSGRVEVVRELVLRDRSMLNDQDDQSRTALHLAAISGHCETVIELLRLGSSTAEV